MDRESTIRPAVASINALGTRPTREAGGHTVRDLSRAARLYEHHLAAQRQDVARRPAHAVRQFVGPRRSHLSKLCIVFFPEKETTGIRTTNNKQVA